MLLRRKSPLTSFKNDNRINYMNNTNNNNEKAELLIELIQNDPYLAFLIVFLSDFEIEPLLHEPITNPKTKTKISATSKTKLLIEQNEKKLEIPILYAKRLVEQKYGKLPLAYY
jgi:hypothetical protein